MFEFTSAYSIDLGKCELRWSNNCIWINSEHGAVLRIKAAKDSVFVNEVCSNNVPHADILAAGPVELCIPTP